MRLGVLAPTTIRSVAVAVAPNNAGITAKAACRRLASGDGSRQVEPYDVTK